MAKGGKKKGGKRKRTQWDDETDVPKKQRGALEGDGDRKKRGESMFTQWKKQKQQLKQKRLVAESTIAQRKRGQYSRLKGIQDDTDEEQDDDDPREDLSDDADSAISDDDDDKPSTFNSFVSRFQRQKSSFQDEDEQGEEVDESDEGDEVEEADVSEDDVGEDGPEHGDHEPTEEPISGGESEADDDESNEPVAAMAGDEDDSDPYRQRYLKQELTVSDVDILSKKPNPFQVVEIWKDLEVSVRPVLTPVTAICGARPLSHIRHRLLEAWTKKGVADLTALQQLLHGAYHQYQDVLYCNQTADSLAEIRQVTMMHVVNHILKSRDTIARHNERLSKGTSEDAEYRDQGFSRPTVLVLAPLRSAAHDLVHQILDLLPPTVIVHNKDRFDEEFGEEDDDDDEDKDDGTEWQKIFKAGNNDDSFQIGVSFARKSVKLYTDYSRADLIVASPLALRQKIGDVLIDIVAGDKSSLKLPVDFLSSIEVCVLDSASVFLMQNMDHVRAVVNAINVTPKEAPSADFSRIREWNLNHQAHHFRQTIVLSHAPDAQLNNLFTKSCHNMRGVTRIAPIYDLQHVVPSVSHVIPSIKQIFQRLDTPSQPAACPLAKEPDARFEYFDRHILAPLLDHPSKHIMIFVPSYLDFVRLRNVFASQKRLISCAAISEYSTDAQISRARSRFYHGQIHVLLITERFHFYKQYKIRGVKQVFWYAPPSLGPFYAEVLNAMESEEDSKSVVVCSRFDTLRMQQIVGSKKAQRMCGSTPDTKSVYMFC
ncbi:hypothetical protein H310_14034 [Aphanomyces invadans]|uniref:U3 small nucleolar RNA-associated protein 25 n=1 Tax=Aphanomyces invadans TaxID=157072 RepID=A0A024TB40_9STRA|nr:hypothetical protein H310_14034 [Aphanomyces invadans]ETV91350.1 hypothetical protein H310_14034 [Aphanomyces invadans]|eukprot:XP_008879978.1 hypothetical protein H310_14034 [Aphanomyces invadans]